MWLRLFQTLVSAPLTSSSVQTTTASATSASAMGDVTAWMARMKWNVHPRMPMVATAGLISSPVRIMWGLAGIGVVPPWLLALFIRAKIWLLSIVWWLCKTKGYNLMFLVCSWWACLKNHEWTVHYFVIFFYYLQIALSKEFRIIVCLTTWR